MKASGLLCVASSLLLAGCGDKPDKPAASAAGGTNSPSAAEAPAGYLGALAEGRRNAVTMADTTTINKAIELFSAERGRNPKDLNELVQQQYISRLPSEPYGMKFVYDAAAGKVSVVKQ